MNVAKWLWTGSHWLRDVRIHVNDGVLHGLQACPAEIAAGEPAWDVVLPAFHNVHSHAFQWAMRGHSQQLVAGHTTDDFWSWRERMYHLAGTLDPELAYDIALECYRAMLRGGYASVGEFHYLHHCADGTRRAPEWAMAEAHVAAARDAGIHLVLIPTAYHRAGPGRAAVPGQRPFLFDSAEDFLRFVDGMRGAAPFQGTEFGVAAHSVRAVPASWLAPIAEYARRGRLPLHIHAHEQRREIAECLAEHGCSPVELLRQCGYLGPNTTLIHATHLSPRDLKVIAESGCTVGACPTTERDLGDGFLEARKMLELGVPVAFGTDSHTRVEAREELRIVEYHERLRHERRNVLTLPHNGQLRPAPILLDWGTVRSAHSLGLASGRIEAGQRADFVALSAHRPIVSEADADLWLDRWLFSTVEPDLKAICVGGSWQLIDTIPRTHRH